MRILGVSLVTNMAAGILDQPLTEKEVLDSAEAAKVPFSGLLLDFLAKVQSA
jgi:purine-nucleoside phosphorylase